MPPPNLLEQLSRDRVPQPPPRLKGEVRERVNHSLVTLQIADFALRALPFALMHFAQAVAGLLVYTMTGTYEPRVREDARRDD